uniref:Uncharacterized protein n=1 Tax=Arundo donax TaxID=35708 RepID=A0A0A8Y9B6_ARUDO
MVRPSGCTV